MSDFWTCDACSSVNEADQTECGACGCMNSDALLHQLSVEPARRVAIDARKQADKWSCELCTFVNKTSFSACKICNHPRAVAIDVDLDGDEGGSTRAGSAATAPFITADVTSSLYHLKEPLLCPKSQLYLCGPCDHYSQRGTAGAGWACGYRNLQMLCSALMHVDKFRAVLFDGAGVVPDVPVLQAWIERAWRMGFDPLGQEQLGGKLEGSTKWIGSTEALALLRSFGIPAKILAFHSFDSVMIERALGRTVAQEASERRRRAEEELLAATGFTADQVLRPFAYNGDGTLKDRPIDAAAKALGTYSTGRSTAKGAKPRRATLEIPTRAEQGVNTYLVKRHAALLRWLSMYFEAPLALSSATPGAFRSNKLPIYFQHDGHSRTLVGFETRGFGAPVPAAAPAARSLADCWSAASPVPHIAPGAKRSRPEAAASLAPTVVDLTDDQGDSTEEDVPLSAMALPLPVGTRVGMPPTKGGTDSAGPHVSTSSQVNLLILDPATSTEALSDAVRTGKNWEKMLKRGLHTLRKPCYEVVYVDPSDSLLTGAALEESKLVVEVHLVE